MAKKMIKKWHIENERTIAMSKDAQILHVSEQYDSLVMWVLDYDYLAIRDAITRTFKVVFTGQAFDDEGHAYVGTAVLHGGQMVAHVFEAKP